MSSTMPRRRESGISVRAKEPKRSRRRRRPLLVLNVGTTVESAWTGTQLTSRRAHQLDHPAARSWGEKGKQECTLSGSKGVCR
jgi:hypothetical protein